jgi:hypothetical protein
MPSLHQRFLATQNNAHDPLTVSLSRQGASRILRSENLADVIARDIAPLPSPAAAN